MLRFAPIFLLSGAALAGGHEGGPHVSNWIELTGHMDDPAIVWLAVTFVVFVAIVVKAARKPLNSHLAARSDEVRDAMAEAAKAKAEAEKKAQEYADRLAKLDDEIEALKADFKKRGEAELVRMKEAGKAQAERIIADAQGTIRAEAEKAQTALKAEAARLSLEIAEERIRSTLSQGDHDRLTKGFLSDLAA